MNPVLLRFFSIDSGDETSEQKPESLRGVVGVLGILSKAGTKSKGGVTRWEEGGGAIGFGWNGVVSIELDGSVTSGMA